MTNKVENINVFCIAHIFNLVSSLLAHCLIAIFLKKTNVIEFCGEFL